MSQEPQFFCEKHGPYVGSCVGCSPVGSLQIGSIPSIMSWGHTGACQVDCSCGYAEAMKRAQDAVTVQAEALAASWAKSTAPITKVYLIRWRYHSCNDSIFEIEAIYSTYEKALAHIKNGCRDLQQQKHGKTKELIDRWSDGDYWVEIAVGYIDSRIISMSKEEFEKMAKEDNK